MLFNSTEFLCDGDLSAHPREGPCTACECPAFKWSRENPDAPAVHKEYPKRERH